MTIARNRSYYLAKRIVALEIHSQKILKKKFAAEAKRARPLKKWREAFVGIEKADEDIARCQDILSAIDPEGDGRPRAGPFVVLSYTLRIAANGIRKAMFNSQYNSTMVECDKWQGIIDKLDLRWQSINDKIYQIQEELGQEPHDPGHPPR